MKIHRAGFIPSALAALALPLAVIQSANAQTFVTNNPLQVARWNQTATLLPNGLVLVAGGETANVYPDNPMRGTNSAELYDPVSGSSALTGSMNSARFANTATLLTNGLVLAVGGRNDGGSIINSAELYDSIDGTWTSTGSLQTERSSFTATLLPSGLVLVAGGYTATNDTSSVELYDPASGDWTNAAPMLYATDSQTATLLTNGEVLVAGGSDGAGGSVTNAILYNPTNNTWVATSPMNTARAGHVATLLPNGQVLVVGGGDNSAELYDPVAGAWTYAASMNDGRQYPLAALLDNGQVLVMAGDPTLATAELYNATSNTWTYTGSLIVPGNFQTATKVHGGQVVVTGGDASDYNGPPLDTVQTYGQSDIMPPPTGTWALTGSLTQSRVNYTLTLLTNGMALAAGGVIGGIPPVTIASAELYNPASGTWTNTGPLTTDRASHTATALTTGWVLVAGGYSGPLGSRVTLASAELYNPATQTWTNTGAMNTPRLAASSILLASGLVLVAGGAEDASSELYDPTNGTWAYTGYMNNVRFNFEAVQLQNGQVLAYGGADTNTAEIYDSPSGTWSNTAPSLIEQDGATMTLLPDGSVLLAGGFDTNDNGLAELYNPATQSWTQTQDMNFPRQEATANLLPNGVVLVAGGLDTNSDVTPDAELYDPATGIWTVTGSMTAALDFAQSVLLPSGQVLVAGGYDASGYNVANTAEIYTTTSANILLSNPMSLAGGAFQFSFTYTPGASSTVFATTDLTLPTTNWTTLGSATEVSSGQFQFTDTQAANFRSRFYRVSSP